MSEYMDEGVNRREQLADKIGRSVASHDPAVWGWATYGAMLALDAIADRDPEAMAAVGLDITDKMVRRVVGAAQDAGDEVGVELTRSDLEPIIRAALNAALRSPS